MLSFDYVMLSNDNIADDTKDTPANRQGCVDPPLFRLVRVDQYIIHILQTEIRLGNSMLKAFFDWVDY